MQGGGRYPRKEEKSNPGPKKHLQVPEISTKRT